ncbi:hypothetical protein TRFO_33979 [Tritrichomonas foetus]|uniref:Uncharacterized protein n=1 Tax=Tritrichomonas foetus TaxID=1144522 RepID=A0A1J4JK94_9EUKA|nr:hypothetical protein TRFO_33979 [Tritrichomonas foetus]|eukprot:OHS99562.1 hypothetical protein TRFO_33979 [Tritrichomonas foetus]
MPEGDLLELYNRLYPKIKSSRNVFFEDLEALAYPASLEEAKAAVQIKGEFFVHPYRAIIPCKTESTDASGLLVCSLIYIISFAAFLAYLVSPFGWLK